MIQSPNQTIEGWRRLLEEEIATQMAYYASRVAAGTDTDVLHWSVVGHQLSNWIAKLNALLADSAALTALTNHYPTWTQSAVQGVVASLQRIQSAALPFVDRSVPGWTQKRPLADVADAEKENLKAVLAAEVQRA